jgi:hypothetical protein
VFWQILLGASAVLESRRHGEHEADHAESAESDQGQHQDGHKASYPAFWRDPNQGTVTAITQFCEVLFPDL